MEELCSAKEWGSSARNSFAQKKVECLIFSFLRKYIFIVDNYSNNKNVYFRSLSYTNVLFKLEMKAQTK